MTERRSQAYVERMVDHTNESSPARPARPGSRDRRSAKAVCGLLVVGLLTSGVAAGPARAADDERTALPIEVEVVGDIDAPLLAVRAVLLDLEGFSRWYPATKEFRVLRRPERDMALVYGVQALPWPVGDRDYVVEYRWRDEPDAFVLLAIAQRDAEPPSPEGVVRVERMRTEWRIEAVPGGGTAVRYRYEGDTGGRLPAWVARLGWRSSTPRVIDGLRDEVARRDAVLGFE